METSITKKKANEKPTKKDKKPKHWTVQVLVLVGLIAGAFLLIPILLAFIVCLTPCIALSFIAYQIASIFKERKKQDRIMRTNANYCRLQLKKMEYVKNSK